ncbi:MAG TPA: squalene/phytoene synthase family protein [Alphaproteobacteria bacterium]|nr:squalene/phytoene synthase family protein [Alphaproteobacteria bacterium]
MAEAAALSYSANQVRQGDPDRFLTALFAPAERREALFALYAFNLEVARIPELVRETMMGQIRLQWWRDRLGEIEAGQPRDGAETPQALAAAIQTGALPFASFETILTARERDLDPTPPADLAEFQDYAQNTAGELSMLAARVLGASDDATLSAARHIGTAWAMIGHLRSLGHHARAGRMTLPRATMGVTTAADVVHGRAREAIVATARSVGAEAAALLSVARALRRDIDKRALPALLLAPLADLHLRKLRSRHFNPLRPDIEIARPRKQAALFLAATLGRY